MNRSQRRALSRLPTTLHTWEIGLRVVPIEIEEVETEGMLVVAERGTGNVRGAGPIVVGESLWSVLGQAFNDPAPPCVPGRPKRVACADPKLIRRLERELKGLRIVFETVASVPAVDAVFGSLQDHFQPMKAPGITTDLELWGPALETLTRIAPWRAVSDTVLFRFEGEEPMLDGAIALVLGQAGEQRGIVLFPSEKDHERYYEAALTHDIDALAEVEALNLYIDPLDELEPDEVAACREAGLVTSDGLCPRVLVTAGQMAAPASDAAQRLLLAVVQGITALTARGADELELVAGRCVASSAVGTIEVFSTPPELEDLEPDLIDAEHAFGLGRIVDHQGEALGLVVKLRKRDAERLAETLAEVDGLRIETEAAGHVVRAMVGEVDLGTLVRFWEEAEVHRLAMADRVVLCVSAGGPKRPRIRPSDFVLKREVLVEMVRGHDRHDPLFDQPVDQWPKASETLLEFAGPLMPGLASLTDSREVCRGLEMACTVWNAVVLADLAGDRGFLVDVERTLQSEPGVGAMVQMMIMRKRGQFAGDPRVFGPVKVMGHGDDRVVYVETRLPPGYEVGRP